MATSIKIGKAEENLSEANMEKVIALLEAEKPITKKLACELLCISYNTTRLGTLIETYKRKVEHRNARRAEKRGTAATQEEIQYTISEYMSGTPVSSIADSMYRGPSFVNSIITKYEVPVKPKSQDYFKPELIPEAAVRTEFAISEKVYSARYDSLARIEALFQKSKEGENVYRILLLDEKWKQSAYQPASELASLEHITKLGVRL